MIYSVPLVFNARYRMSIKEQEAFVFRFLSLAFAYPNEAFLSELQCTADKINDQAGAYREVVALFKKEEEEILQAEYTRLFINGYPHTPCPPYESVYLEKRVLGEASIKVEALYREWDMSVERGLSDHIATEFEFLAFLASAGSLKTLAAAASDASERFMIEHLSRWLPEFIADLKSAASLDVYKRLATLIESSLFLIRPSS